FYTCLHRLEHFVFFQVFAFLLINLIITPVKYYHSSACGRAEYETNGQCCPMCSLGTRVYKDCTDYTSTSCVPCTEATFTDKLNRLITCFPCTVCDKGFGLKTVKECTASSDTVCGVLEGNYCVDPYEGGCRKAEKHTTCKPGQFIEIPGLTGFFLLCLADITVHKQMHLESPYVTFPLLFIVTGIGSADAECSVGVFLT
ncbi:tumor necrosis factor receptor superfamily member 5-like isoform X1, partial [Arapaima gigas]